MNQGAWEKIVELAEACGVLPQYWDIFGKLHTTSVETRKAMLEAMKIPDTSVSEMTGEIAERKLRPWKSFVEPALVFSVNAQPLKIPVYIPLGSGSKENVLLRCVVRDEDNGTEELKFPGHGLDILGEKVIEGIRYIKTFLPVGPGKKTGYYKATVECMLRGDISPGVIGTMRKEIKLIVTPDACYLPAELQPGKAWGIAVNLYALHSKRSWGIGDFGDLKTMVDIAAPMKADFIGLNPLHAIPNTYPYGVSPYSPVSRIYKNFLYLDIESIPEVMNSEQARESMKAESFRRKIRKLRKAEKVDYAQVSLLKGRILRQAFEFFYAEHYGKNTARDNDFRGYLAREGESLESFATFLALWHAFRKTKSVYAWQSWPEEYHDPRGRAVRTFQNEQRKEVLFYQYLQWLIDEQLLSVARYSRESGMNIGLYHDLAIGAIAGGSDVWNNQEVIGDADVGAPPDDFNPNGQNWGFPPVIPDRLKEDGYALFIETIRNNMKYGGALRIDHALGLFRLFWIPSGVSARDGAYLMQPAEELLRIIALESERNKTIVIAEDLGTIDDTFREMLQSFQMLSYRLFYFERNYPDPSFRPPDQYRTMALCAITTHDLPTVYGYWEGRDIERKKRLGIYGDEEAWRSDLAARERDKGLILSALKRQGIIPEDFPDDPRALPHMTHELCMAIYRYLAQTPCKILLVSLDDVLGTLDQQNMPGTVDEHPNWIQKTPYSLEDIAHDKRFLDLASLLD